jgi:LPXTG-site transpeptidase (sortase) family protein
MQLKIPLKWSLAILGITVIAYSAVMVFLLAPDLPDQISYTTAISLASNQQNDGTPGESFVIPETVKSGLPVRFVIPKINVDATIEYVGVTSDGSAMDVPKKPADVAWFNLGPRPGEIGSAVIAGHYGWRNNVPAVFDNLRKLIIGDTVYVEDAEGATATFVVREIRTYTQQADATDVFISSDGLAHLNLITCEGTWSKAQQSYSNRLVVFTDKK